MRLTVWAMAGLFMSIMAHAELKSETVQYKDGDTVLEGYIVYDAKLAAKRPGIVMIPDWLGVRDLAKKSADDLAKLGYTVLLADMYGKDVRPKDAKEASALVAKYKGDRALMRRRTEAALKELVKHKTVNGDKVAAMGYCFGGTAALEMGRNGDKLKGIVTFHGGLDTPNPADGKNIKGRVLVLHGADDPYVPPADVAAFEKEMNGGKVDWELIMYSGAVHAFTIKDAGNDNSKGAAYNEKADKRSWEAMKQFLKEIF
jgi:dienelactone hydrolase